MASLRVRCMQCGRPIVVPMEAAYSMSIMCYACQGQAQARNSLPQNYYFPNNNINNVPSYLPRPGYGYARRPYNQFYNPQPLQLVAPPPPPPLTPPSSFGNKRAVLVGISYGNRSNNLKGSVNDAQSMKYFLVNNLDFPTDSIRILTGTFNYMQ
ncbi:hypothetical protein V8G54_032229 [Vigna mungo]|uniref:Peptidase C14 caspase domain-containing protein n=1 Tax=Vigna mungo TaxID=3915 RepID=A0AAQ3MLJ9_VIGMU